MVGVVLIVFAVASAGEALQCFVPSRTPDVTDPLIAACVAVAVAMLHVNGGEAAAQVEVTGTASIISVRGTSFGVGGRLGVPVKESFDMGIRIEGAFDYYWPSCSLDCNLAMGHLNVVFQNRFGDDALAYFGAGATYEDYALVQNGTLLEDTGWGMNLVVGSRTQTLATFRPFVEIRWILINDIQNQFAFTLGGALVLGG